MSESTNDFPKDPRLSCLFCPKTVQTLTIFTLMETKSKTININVKVFVEFSLSTTINLPVNQLIDPSVSAPVPERTSTSVD